jgi:hypothetical protein
MFFTSDFGYCLMSDRINIDGVQFGIVGLAEGIDIPPALQASVRRHQENLAQLAKNLQKMGLSLEKVEESINMLVETYRSELLGAVRALMDRDYV